MACVTSTCDEALAGELNLARASDVINFGFELRGCVAHLSFRACTLPITSCALTPTSYKSRTPFILTYAFRERDTMPSACSPDDSVVMHTSESSGHGRGSQVML